ncbi:MAG TPA: sugar transferase, partial [Aquabacterium sp.]|nr:sugar transferase [Aquabacterium sp.]
MVKRLFDLLMASLGLLLLGPVLVAIAIWIKLDSPGPVFFRQQRVG